jgi:hypothetical protein
MEMDLYLLAIAFIFALIGLFIFSLILNHYFGQAVRVIRNTLYEDISKSMHWTTECTRKVAQNSDSHFNTIHANMAINHRELTRLIGPARHNKPQVFLKGPNMDGTKLVYTIARPQLTAGDIKEWVAKFFINGNLVRESVLPVEMEAFDFKVVKGTTGLQVGVFFRDTSGNAGEITYSETFDAIDNVPPAAPGSVTLTVREETEDDADVIEIGMSE